MENRFEQLVGEEEQEDEIEDTIDIPSLVSSEDEEEESEILRKQELEGMIRVIGRGEQRRQKQRQVDTAFRERENEEYSFMQEELL
eukprot:2557745-Karenia_brevis.AAC.1